MDCINENWKYDKYLNTYFKRFLIQFTNPDYCVNKYGFDYPWWKKNEILKPCFVAFTYYLLTILSIIFIFSMVSNVSAAQTINSSINITEITDNSITWNVKYLSANRPIGATIDGVEIEGFNTLYNINYTGKNFEKNTSHTFCVYGSATINCETGKTTNLGTPEEQFWIFIIKYLLIFVTIIFIFIGIRIPLCAIIAFAFGLINWLNAITIGEFWYFFISTLILLATLISGYYSDKNSRG